VKNKYCRKREKVAYRNKYKGGGEGKEERRKEKRYRLENEAT
jgi:hypothetical protein